MRVTLFIPCFVDLCFPKVGVSIVRILEQLGHTIDYPEELACCGQPAFNSGCWPEARSVARPVLQRQKDAEVVVIASGSCGAMLKVFYPELFAGTEEVEAAAELASKVYEFSDFLVTKLGVTDLGSRFPARVTFHDGCHGLRELGNKTQPRVLLSHVRELELVEMGDAETCCGFGGTFAAKFPSISTAMGEIKCASAGETKADYIVSNDPGCLMHIQGLLDRHGASPLSALRHITSSSRGATNCCPICRAPSRCSRRATALRIQVSSHSSPGRAAPATSNEFSCSARTGPRKLTILCVA